MNFTLSLFSVLGWLVREMALRAVAKVLRIERPTWLMESVGLYTMGFEYIEGWSRVGSVTHVLFRDPAMPWLVTSSAWFLTDTEHLELTRGFGQRCAMRNMGAV